MQTLIDLSDRPVKAGGHTIEQVRAFAQREADAAGAEIAIGWQLCNATGEKELGYCPAAVAPSNAFVIEVLETVKPYTGGRANFEARQESRRERLENAASRAKAESSRRFKAASAAVAGIPFGQPILVGHHSEKRHRRDLARHDTNMRAGIEAQKRAGELAGRAASVGGAGISSDDPEAVRKLREELAALTQVQEQMKAANKVIRQHRLGRNATAEQRIACAKDLVGIGMSNGAAAQLVLPDVMGNVGYPDYRMKNNGANCRRIEKRIEILMRNAQVPEGEVRRSRCGVIFQIQENRVQLVFEGKPSQEIRDRLKGNGFRWSPTSGAWQRQLSSSARYWANEFISWLDARAAAEVSHAEV
jgi:hypothetical protein